MPSKAPIPSDGGYQVKNEATFYVNNKVYEGFKNITIQRSLTQLTGAFEITLVDKHRVEKEDFELKAGLKISCKLGNTLLYSGYIDNISISLTESSRNITIRGRDNTGDLIDCSVINKNEFNNLKLEAIAKEILKPFGLGVITFADTGENIEKFTINQGETAFQALERLSKKRKLLMTSSPTGNLVFEKKGVIRSSTELKEGENILGAAVSFNNADRFSEYIVKSQSTSRSGDILSNTQAEGRSKDLGIDRYRPTVIVSDSASTIAESQERAAWESSLRAAQAMEVSVSTQGWTQKNGEIWAVNQIVHLDCRSIGINADLLIREVRFAQSESGRRVELVLIRKDAFEFKIEIEKEDDPLSTIGWGD